MVEDFRAELYRAATLGQLGRVAEGRLMLVQLRSVWGRPLEELEDELRLRHGFSNRLARKLIEGLELAGAEELATGGR